MYHNYRRGGSPWSSTSSGMAFNDAHNDDENELYILLALTHNTCTQSHRCYPQTFEVQTLQKDQGIL